MQIILASGSPRRKELLSSSGVEYTVITSDTDESTDKLSPKETVQELSGRKAKAVQQMLAEQSLKDPDHAQQVDKIIIGADTIVSCDGQILGKPENREHAKEMLFMLSGKTHQVYTGVTLLKINAQGMVTDRVCFAEGTDVSVRKLTEKEICEYLLTGECDDKAGSYAIQGIFGKYIEKIEGDYNNVVGLPVDRVLQELRNLGYNKDTK